MGEEFLKMELVGRVEPQAIQLHGITNDIERLPLSARLEDGSHENSD
jgi:hypothetical protein